MTVAMENLATCTLSKTHASLRGKNVSTIRDKVLQYPCIRLVGNIDNNRIRNLAVGLYDIMEQNSCVHKALNTCSWVVQQTVVGPYLAQFLQQLHKLFVSCLFFFAKQAF
jgi:hypothetical protein